MSVVHRPLSTLVIAAALLLALVGCASTASARSATATATVSAPTWTALPQATITHGSDWIPLRSTSAADIIAAVRASLPKTYQGGDSFPITATSPTGMPVLVLALCDSDFQHAPDFYVVPILTSSGAPVADVTLELNASHTAYRQGGIFGGGARFQGIIWQYSASQAVSALVSQRHVALKADFKPVLVYWPVNATHFETGELAWNGGSLGPTTPVWLLRGENGVYYMLANNGHFFALSEMPLHTLPPAGY